VPRALSAIVLGLALLGAPSASSEPSSTDAASQTCAPLVLAHGYVSSVERALRATTDAWGNRALSRPEGPTYRNVKGYLKPLFLVGRPAGVRGTALTDSGVYYVPMGEPGGRSFADAGPTEPFALHVADGSQIASHRPNGRRTTMYVGGNGAERYGSCLSRLSEPELVDGYLPVLAVRYTDAEGVRYEQESFVGSLPAAGGLASFVRLTATAGSSGRQSAEIRVTTTEPSLSLQGRELRAGGRTHLAFSPDGDYDPGSGLRFRLDLSGGKETAIYLIRPIDPAPARLEAGAAGFDSARAATVDTWQRRLAEGARIVVPDRRVMDAMRNLLIQNLQLGWRYSLGNVYETFYHPESNAAVLRLAEYGFLSDARQGLTALVSKTRKRSTNWEQGEKLAGGAAYFLLSGDRAFLRRHAPAYARYARDFAKRRALNQHGLLDRQRYSGDIPDAVYGFHHQSRAWRGLRDMAFVWGLTGRTALAVRYRREARSFGGALRKAIAESSVDVSPQETFVPVSLLESPPEQPWDPVTATRQGSYWNLVAPYGWASDIIPRGSALGKRVLAYARRRGSFLLGLVRFDYYPTGPGRVTCDGLPGLRTPGANNVYGVHRVQALAAFDRPDLLVLTLYGKLAHGMTRGTFVAGEGDTIGPVPPGACSALPDGEYFRSMYLPPSSASNDLFLVTLREQLAHWFARDDGRPRGLHLAFATPRAWLADGKRIIVERLPTPFGRLSYWIDSHIATRYVDLELQVPSRRAIGDLRLRIRLPGSKRPVLARIGTETVWPDGDTFDLTGRTGRVRVRVVVR
jgi:hypothetical protein